MADPARPVLLYDGDCRLCRFAIRTIARLDRDDRLGFLPLDDVEAAPLLQPLPPEERYATWHLVTGTNAVGRGGGAVDLARTLRLTRPAAAILGLAPAHVLDRLYELVARHRSRLGRLVPDGPAPRRYP